MPDPESIAAYRRAASAVDAAAVVRSRAARAAQAGWAGPARDAFDRELSLVQREAAALVDDLLAAAAARERAWEQDRLRAEVDRCGVGPR